MANNDTRTRAFETAANHKRKFKSKRRIRQQVVISIFVVIALILIVFATLIIGKIITIKNTETPPEAPIYSVELDESAIHSGNLLLIKDNSKYSLPLDLSEMIKISDYREETSNAASTQINGKYTYALTYKRICLSKDTLDAFNKMILDYCNSPEFTPTNNEVVSNLEIGWGGYSEATRGEYQTDIERKDFYDHGLGTTLTLKNADYHTRISEEDFKNNYGWLYNNAYKYGFILRYPNACQNHTDFNSSETIHLRYIGVEHATYIHENGCCLDEYLKTIREQYSYNNPLEFTANGKTYNVYYVEYSGNPTNVPIPQDKNYYISGDNMNGFIVTVEK